MHDAPIDRPYYHTPVGAGQYPGPGYVSATPILPAARARDGDGPPALILWWQGGLWWTVQCGGGMKDQRMAKGVRLPLLGALDPRRFTRALEDLHPGCQSMGISAAEADAVDKILVQQGLPLEVSRDRLAHSTEAWVYVTVLGTKAALADHGLTWWAGTHAVLTWANCD